MKPSSGIPEQLAIALAGGYELERELGHGGMATVYLARDRKHQRKVAVKVLHPDLGVALGAERFLREIEVTARLQHPNILPVFDSGAADGQLYYVMPYVEGESLRERLARERQMPVQDAVFLTCEIADALDCAHEQGIVHRDIKPDNVLLARGHALVMDFGVARAPASALDGTGSLTLTGDFSVGTPRYMSPEQALADRDIDGRSDEYSLACVAFEMLTGSSPFTGGGGPEVVQKFTRGAPSASAKREGLPPAVDAVLARGMALEPEKRYPTAGEFAAALEEAADLESVLGARSFRLRRAWRARSLRHMVAAAVLAVVAVGGISLAAWNLAVGARSVSGMAERRPSGAGVAAGSPEIAPSVAVLPFLNIGGDTAMEYFADGMTEELIRALSRVEGLHVAARTSVFALKGKSLDARTIGDTLHVGTLLEGSVRRAGGRLRVGAQLVSTRENEVLWAASYDREVQDVFRVQDEISRAIVSALEIRLRLANSRETTLVRPPTADLEAHDAYLRGRFLWNQRTYASLLKASAAFEGAISHDSLYAHAWAGLADTYLVLPFFGPVPSREAYATAKRAARRALALDTTLVEARTSLAYARMLGDFDWEGAETEFRRAIALDPNHANAHHWYAVYLWAVGRTEAAVAASERAFALDPLSRIIGTDLGEALIFAGRYGDAQQQLRAIIELDPSFPYAYNDLCWVHLLQGQAREAVAACERAVALSGRNLGLGYLAHAYVAAGHRERAALVLHELETRARTEYVSPWSIALAQLALGDVDATFAWLGRALNQRDPYLTAEGARNPLWAPLWQDSRFARIRERLGLAP